MSVRQKLTLVLAAFLGGCVAAQVTRIPEARAFAGPRWEYRVIRGFTVGEDDLNTAGAEGWELVTCSEHNSCVLKRPRG